MNEFTKEEIEYIYRKFMLTNGNDFEHALEAKLQRMIDGYSQHGCRHESDGMWWGYKPEYWHSAKVPEEKYKCTKCGEFYR